MSVRHTYLTNRLLYIYINIFPVRNLVTIVCLVILSLNSYSQSPVWVNTIGSNATDEAFSLDKDMIGNIYLSGRFSGTADFDPGPGIFNLTSNGLTDAYVAKYNTNGQLIWAFAIGSTSYDGSTKLKINNAGEVLVTGYYRYNVDFDPGAGTYFLNGTGQAGTDVGFGGDIFLAKYSSAGIFMWAFQISGEFSQDKPEGIDLDDNDNIYLLGAVNCTSSTPIDADPGPAVFDIGGVGHGHAFVAKYTTNSNFVWAFNLGQYGLNSGGNRIKIVPGDTSFVIVGFYRGTNVDFDPNAGTYILNSNGAEDMMVAKYSLNKTFMWAYSTGGSGPDIGIELDIDPNRDIYVSGWFNGTNIDFNPSGTVSSNLNSNGGLDAFLLKYSENGDYRWAKSFGGALDDIGWGVSLNGGQLLTTGEFRNTVDFDPSAATFNLISNGGSDMFISRFDTIGNFLCAENIGGVQDERGYVIKTIAIDSFLICGNYSTNNIDFDPSTTVTMIKTNAGQSDAYLSKFFSNNLVNTMNPTLIGDTVCQGATPQLIINFGTGVTGSYSVVINNGTSNQTYNGITSGVPFSPTPLPTGTTTYTLVSVANLAAGCSSITIPNGISATVTIKPTPPVTANASPSSVCPGNPTILTGNGAATYTWSSGATNGVPFIPGATSTYTVTGTDAFGCTSSAIVAVSVVNNLTINILPSEPVICIGDSVHLSASGANSYTWLPNTSISSVNVPDPFVFPSSPTTYTVIGTDATGCTGTASILIDVVTNPKMIVSKSGDVECAIQTIQLSASGTSTSYVWSPATFLSSPNSGVTNATLTQTTTFVVTGTVGSCVITDSITVGVYTNDETAIFIPNAFSPNGDGTNDCLRVLNKANFTSYYFAIYNRWGQRVFEADSPDKCWDGNFNNQPVLLDVYYYFLKAETRCGKVFKKGDITVIR